MIVAIVKASPSTGQVAIEELRVAASVAAAVSAFVAEYSPPLSAGDYLGHDTGWSSVPQPALHKRHGYDHDSPGMVEVSSGDLAEAIKAIIYPTIEPPIESTVQVSGLVITIDVVELITNDQTTIVADPTDTKYAQACLIHNNTTDAFLIAVREYTTGYYADFAADEVCVEVIGEWSVVANGATLVAV